MRSRSFAVVVVPALLLGLFAGPARAQVPDRRADLEDAAAAFDFQRAVGRLMPILDPAAVGPDSLWAQPSSSTRACCGSWQLIPYSVANTASWSGCVSAKDRRS